MAAECKMNEMNFDYLTMTYIDKRVDKTVDNAVNNVLDVLQLGDIWDKFTYVGRNRFYPYLYRYNDITIKVCDEEKLGRQGLCIEFTGNGLAFYQEHLQQKGENLRRICQAWRSLAVAGIFTKFTRVDVAKDEKRYNGDAPNLTLRKIRCAVNNNEVRSRFLVERGRHNRTLDLSEDFGKKNTDDNGYTISFGKRTSLIYCRFYDKLLEQQSKGLPVEEGLTSWVRCEFEFHNSRAMAVINAYCDMYDDVSGENGFSEYIAEVFNNYICFINRDDVNRSRCSSKRWWAAFIGTVKRSSLVVPRFKPVTFRSVAEWLEKKIFPTLNIYVRCVGLQRFLAMLKRSAKDCKRTAKQIQIENDFIHEFINNAKKPEECADNLALAPWLFTSQLTETDFVAEFEKEYRRFHILHGNGWEPIGKDDEAMQYYMSSLYDFAVAR